MNDYRSHMLAAQARHKQLLDESLQRAQLRAAGLLPRPLHARLLASLGDALLKLGTALHNRYADGSAPQPGALTNSL